MPCLGGLQGAWQSLLCARKKDAKSCQSFVGAHQKVSNMHNKFGSSGNKREAEKAEPGKGKRERKRDSIQLDLCIVFYYYNTIFYKEKYKSQICKRL